ncbi:hypothetical protein INS49_011029 [Diaporthe citri]|uniref:uncharacterized protein n=1 Tax=Diaporthe citri TaxID=83186 RepID=UPI001C80D1CF|nr:uncharacterized protein INS49_011029 [Diaporthe citri]KAG6359975.1 hypothetical protein INS49_011029 [Diaporthe citri]
MLFGKKKYELIVGKLVSPIPQLGDSRFTVTCFVYLEGEKAGSPKWHNVHERSRFHVELQLQQLDGNTDETATSAPQHPMANPIDGLEGPTSLSGLHSKVTENGGLRFDLDRLHILPEIEKGTFRIHAALFRAHFNLLRSSEYELLAEADSETFTRGDMTKHRLPEGWEEFQGCGGFR